MFSHFGCIRLSIRRIMAFLSVILLFYYIFLVFQNTLNIGVSKLFLDAYF